MFKAAIHLLLVASIVACPLGCYAGACCAQDRGAGDKFGASQSCCERCRHEETPSHSPEHPSAPAEPCSEKCQGICGGAVVEKHVELDLAPLRSIDALCMDNAAQVDAIGIAYSPANSPPYGGDVLSGRNVRVLHKSLLC